MADILFLHWKQTKEGDALKPVGINILEVKIISPDGDRKMLVWILATISLLSQRKVLMKSKP